MIKVKGRDARRVPHTKDAAFVSTVGQVTCRHGASRRSLIKKERSTTESKRLPSCGYSIRHVQVHGGLQLGKFVASGRRHNTVSRDRVSTAACSSLLIEILIFQKLGKGNRRFFPSTTRLPGKKNLQGGCPVSNTPSTCHVSRRRRVKGRADTRQHGGGTDIVQPRACPEKHGRGVRRHTAVALSGCGAVVPPSSVSTSKRLLKERHRVKGAAGRRRGVS